MCCFQCLDSGGIDTHMSNFNDPISDHLIKVVLDRLLSTIKLLIKK